MCHGTEFSENIYMIYQLMFSNQITVCSFGIQIDAISNLDTYVYMCSYLKQTHIGIHFGTLLCFVLSCTVMQCQTRFSNS